MYNVLFLTPIQPGSGNIATALRITNGLEKYLKNITIENSNNYKSYHQIKNIENIDLIICVHAYHSGRLFYKDDKKQQEQEPLNKIKLITIFGGTDVHSPNYDWLNIINNTINISYYLICFSEELMLTVIKYYPYCKQKCLIIPQGVYVNPSMNFRLYDYNIDINNRIDSNYKLISWIGSIRKVKDPLYIDSILNDIYLIDKKIIFIFAGYSLDDSLVKSLKNLEIKNKNFFYINGLNNTDAHALIASSWAFINTSINEGMSLAILEAMKLKVPVIVRKNFGNCSIVKHKFNGLIFENKIEFIENLLFLLNNDNDDFKKKLIFNAFNYVNDNHSCELEAVSYYKCIFDSLKSTTDMK